MANLQIIVCVFRFNLRFPESREHGSYFFLTNCSRLDPQTVRLMRLVFANFLDRNRTWRGLLLWKCFEMLLEHEDELEDASQIKPVVRSALMLCSSIYIMTSIFGFLLFGDDTLDDHEFLKH